MDEEMKKIFNFFDLFGLGDSTSSRESRNKKTIRFLKKKGSKKALKKVGSRNVRRCRQVHRRRNHKFSVKRLRRNKNGDICEDLK